VSWGEVSDNILIIENPLGHIYICPSGFSIVIREERHFFCLFNKNGCALMYIPLEFFAFRLKGTISVGPFYKESYS